MSELLPLKVQSYALDDGTTLERMKQRDGEDKWAIRLGGSVLNHATGKFQYEPLPSSRSDAFLRDCRFPTASAAYAFWRGLNGEES